MSEEYSKLGYLSWKNHPKCKGHQCEMGPKLTKGKASSTLTVTALLSDVDNITSCSCLTHSTWHQYPQTMSQSKPYFSRLLFSSIVTLTRKTAVSITLTETKLIHTYRLTLAATCKGLSWVVPFINWVKKRRVGKQAS